MKNSTNTYGAEIEKPISSFSSRLPFKVTNSFFMALKKAAQKRGAFDHIHYADLKSTTALGVATRDVGEQGIDNGFNLLETAIPYQTSLNDLQKLVKMDLASTQEALEKEGASIINMSIHPLGKRDLETYCDLVAPKGLYPSLWYRGIDHAAGIDARAQNSPATGVTIMQAVDAMSVMCGAGAAIIALFANSPFEYGDRSGYKESRLLIWPRMMSTSKIKGDRETINFPTYRFRTLAQYFNWMFGGNTGLYFVVDSEKKNDYKNFGDKILIVDGNPSVLEFLSKREWQAYNLNEVYKSFPPKPVVVKPTINHLEVSQFAQFTGARIRFGLKNHENFPIDEFVNACKDTNKTKVEDLMKNFIEYMYIEGRDPGANFPDREIASFGKEIADSIVISPSSLQAGLLQNLEKAVELIDSYKWETLNKLRSAAIKDGLHGEADGVSVKSFTEKVLSIASEGLEKSDRKFLAYPEYVLKSGKNGADRAIETFDKTSGSMHDRLVQLVTYRNLHLF